MQVNEPFFLIVSIIAGLVLGAYGYTFQGNADAIITLSLILMLYGVMLGIPFGRILDASKNLRFITLSIAVNFLFVPLFAWWLSQGFVREPAVLLGLLMYFVMPCTDWFLVFTNSAKGDAALGTVLVPINLALQVILLPVYILLFIGNTVPLNPDLFSRTLLLFLLIPLSLAAISRRWGRTQVNRLISKSQAVFLGVAVAVMFASQGEMFLEKLREITVILIPIIMFFIGMYFFSMLLSRIINLPHKKAVLLTFITSARNSPIAFAIALGAFPTMPLASLVIAIAPIIEIPFLAFQARILRTQRQVT